ncbi:MAG: S10 family serine carboxypeptidase-like protein, partial [Luteolibacter sp.]
MRLTQTLLCLLSLAPLTLANDSKDSKDSKKSSPNAAHEKPAETQTDAPAESVESHSEVQIDGKTIPYRAVTGKLQLKDDKGKARASIFHVSYLRSDVDDSSQRPVMFAFNGGPGSSSVWLHIGVLGPRIIKLPGDGTLPAPPPLRVEENPFSILDVCDLVFVDPVSTGYSRAENDVKAADFHGLNEDIESIGDFVRRWITENDRWGSPKFLLGESYGGIRVAGLAQHLQSRYGMNLNGVVLLSSL